VGEHRGEHNQFQKSNRTGAKRSNMEKSRKPKGFSLHSGTLAIYLLLCPLPPFPPFPFPLLPVGVANYLKTHTQ